jgi:5-methyltetrahydrofolate--homocysteine methyltransferase|tara:strand:- start:272 stop:1216 length:945 start_codon:yes stop_codon:yes gene_type:complete
LTIRQPTALRHGGNARNDKGKNAMKELLEEQGYLLADGAMGTLLFDCGLEAGMAPEALNLHNKEMVYKVHEAYITAGSDVILTNTFGGNEFRLTLHELGDVVTDVNRAAVEIARQAVDAQNRKIFIAGSMGPTGGLLEPLGILTLEDVKDAYKTQAVGLVDGGVDILWLETFSDLNEVEAAITGIRAVTDLPIIVTMSYDTAGHTMMGVSGTSQAALSNSYDLFGIGANCGATLEDARNAIKDMRTVCKNSVIVFKPNAGIPEWHGDDLVYNGTPEIMAEQAAEVIKEGLTIIGACCGSTPEHIAFMKKRLMTL